MSFSSLVAIYVAFEKAEANFRVRERRRNGAKTGGTGLQGDTRFDTRRLLENRGGEQKFLRRSFASIVMARAGVGVLYAPAASITHPPMTSLSKGEIITTTQGWIGYGGEKGTLASGTLDDRASHFFQPETLPPRYLFAFPSPPRFVPSPSPVPIPLTLCNTT